MVYGKRKCLKVFKNVGTAEIACSSFVYRGVDKMTYTLLGFGLTLTVLLGIETIRERK